MLDNGQYPKIGETDQKAPVYELDIYDFLQILDPLGRFELNRVDPLDYYITSGDAVQKAEFLCGVLWSYAGRARKQLYNFKKPTAEEREFEKECWRQAGAARKLLNILRMIRGEDVFLETEWSDKVLICIKKNPRPKQK